MDSRHLSEIKSFVLWIVAITLLSSVTVLLLSFGDKLSPMGIIVGGVYQVVSVLLFAFLFSLDANSKTTLAIWVLAISSKFPVLFLFIALCAEQGGPFVCGAIFGVLTFVPAATIHEMLRVR